jgi:hypothetical protein
VLRVEKYSMFPPEAASKKAKATIVPHAAVATGNKTSALLAVDPFEGLTNVTI